MAVEHEKEPCWYVVCDECGEGDGEDGSRFHYPSREEAVREAEGVDFRIDGDRAICLACWDQLPTEEGSA
jgi:hypothetical protein